MSAKKPVDLPKSYLCTQCHTEHQFPGYVYAHWDVDITHTCDCGARHNIRRGEAEFLPALKSSQGFLSNADRARSKAVSA